MADVDKTSVFRINRKPATGGDGHTQFGCALYELTIDGICANTPAAKGRFERAHRTMQAGFGACGSSAQSPELRATAEPAIPSMPVRGNTPP